MTRKSSIEKVVEWSRENYGQDLIKPNVQEDAVISEKRKCSDKVMLKNSENSSLDAGNEVSSTVTSSQSYELNLRM